MPPALARFRFLPSPTLPRLAWGAVVHAGREVIDVHHGEWVETHPAGFSEGVWNGPFGEGKLAEASVCMGSGAQLRDGAVAFATPTHTFERLHYVRRGDALIVANSLPFALSLAGDRPQPTYAGYIADLRSFTDGLHHYVDRLPTLQGNQVRVVYHANLVVDGDLRVGREEKGRTPAFHDFDGYVALLADSLAALVANGADPARRRPYWPLATLSSGYDSPACAVLARAAGCTEAITFTRARATFGGADDSGRAIGDILGYTVHEFDREAYLQMDGFPEAEFLASGPGGEEVVFAPLQDILPQRIFITGYAGDSAWNRHSLTTNDEFWMRFPGGSAFGEFRLRVGFVHVPLPVVALRDMRLSVAVSNLPEMRPWCIGGSYDRPIPRRLVEEAGVPREFFGQEKKAVLANMADANRHATTMTPASARDFASFARDLPPRPSLQRRLGREVLRLAGALETRVLWRQERRANRAGRPCTPRRRIPAAYTERPARGDFTFHWAVEKLLPRYGVRPPDR